MTYLIVDDKRLPDLQRMDTTADTPEQARAEAEAMAKRWGCRVYVLAVAGEVEGTVEPRWAQALSGGAV
jgi:hypothetical protein